MPTVADIVRAGVAVAYGITNDGGFLSNVSHAAWTGVSADGYGTDQYASPVTRRAFVEIADRTHTIPGGRSITSKAYLLFQDPITNNGAAGRTEPIDARDKFTLPGGLSWPVVDVRAPLGEGLPFIVEVWLGDQHAIAAMRPD